MTFNVLTSSALLLGLLALHAAGPANGLCLSCQAPFKTKSVASHLTLPARGVYNPKITKPTANTVWKVHDKVIVTWDTRDMPAGAANRNGELILGIQEAGSDNEHLMLNRPLATNFSLSDGRVSVKVPPVAPGTNYIVVLFGDSGNRSPAFEIKQ